jgi:hypothetical protein
MILLIYTISRVLGNYYCEMAKFQDIVTFSNLSVPFQKRREICIQALDHRLVLSVWIMASQPEKQFIEATVPCAVRGYHVYKEVWRTYIGDEFLN